MTRLARASLEALRSLGEALSEARKLGEQNEEYYRRARDAYIALGTIILAMQAEGKIDPETNAEAEKLMASGLS